MDQYKIWKHCWCECKVAWPFGKIIYYLIKLNMCIFYDTAVLVLEIFWKTCICALSDIYKTICSVTVYSSKPNVHSRTIDDLVYLYNDIIYNDENKNKQQLHAAVQYEWTSQIQCWPKKQVKGCNLPKIQKNVKWNNTLFGDTNIYGKTTKRSKGKINTKSRMIAIISKQTGAGPTRYFWGLDKFCFLWWVTDMASYHFSISS